MIAAADRVIGIASEIEGSLLERVENIPNEERHTLADKWQDAGDAVQAIMRVLADEEVEVAA